MLSSASEEILYLTGCLTDSRNISSSPCSICTRANSNLWRTLSTVKQGCITRQGVSLGSMGFCEAIHQPLNQPTFNSEDQPRGWRYPLRRAKSRHRRQHNFKCITGCRPTTQRTQIWRYHGRLHSYFLLTSSQLCHIVFWHYSLSISNSCTCSKHLTAVTTLCYKQYPKIRPLHNIECGHQWHSVASSLTAYQKWWPWDPVSIWKNREMLTPSASRHHTLQKSNLPHSIKVLQNQSEEWWVAMSESVKPAKQQHIQKVWDRLVEEIQEIQLLSYTSSETDTTIDFWQLPLCTLVTGFKQILFSRYNSDCLMKQQEQR